MLNKQHKYLLIVIEALLCVTTIHSKYKYSCFSFINPAGDLVKYYDHLHFIDEETEAGVG